jgi:hypothetical protein
VLTALESIHEKLTGTQGTYTATEESNKSTVNKLQGMLGG